MKLEYRATFGIDCGLSHGFGLKEPHYEIREEVVIADNDMNATLEAAKRAIRFSRDYLSNPTNDDFTTVTLLNLYGPLGRGLINQKKLFKRARCVGIKNFKWIEGKLVTRCSSLEHAFLLVHSST
jgi:hypothetical protein